MWSLSIIEHNIQLWKTLFPVFDRLLVHIRAAVVHRNEYRVRIALFVVDDVIVERRFIFRPILSISVVLHTGF